VEKVKIGKWVEEEMGRVARVVEIMGEKVDWGKVLEWEKVGELGGFDREIESEEGREVIEREEGKEKDESFYENLKDYIMFSNYKNYRGQKFNS
jgi:hypothetical protein